jgi:nitrite reductase (NO-forming)
MNTKLIIPGFSATIILLCISVAFIQPDPSLEASIQRGKELYNLHCQSCHMANGEGVGSVFPPLAKADYMLADRNRAIKETIFGVSGEMLINGKTYNGNMSPVYIDDQETADVLTYIFNSWGNKGKTFTTEEVAKVRDTAN